ncbi:sensor histidine kinase [Cellulomonas sp. URHE0023]|uniref:sensor histidine kinase n=1 Tax=Cellulomonas sp. URHE0023 TaxID=1380354 RepID=UPI000489D6B0|nr:ATP-binding protein [Cellulomonas sp. URHE0023]
MTMTPTDSAAAVAARHRDSGRDRTTLLRATAGVALGYGIGAALQATYVYSVYVTEWAVAPFWSRIAANVAAVAALVGCLALIQAHRARTLAWMLGAVLLAATVGASTRYGAQVVLGIYDQPQGSVRDAELLSGLLMGTISGLIGMWAMVSRRAMRERIRAATRDAVHIEVAVKALEQEEIRVRRAVAEGLHGTLQSKLVLVDARLASLLSRRGEEALDEESRTSVEWIRAELDAAREIDVREMSRLLYPDRLELGLVPALRGLLGRIPASVATQLVVSDAVRALDDPASGSLTVSERLLAVRVVEEGITNALKHGPPGSVRVVLDVSDRLLHVGVENDGELYDPASAGDPSGTARLGTRLSLVGGRLELSPGSDKGAHLDAWLPLGNGPL